MAIFEGDIREFHDHLGPRIRNLINGYARKERKSRNGICEECGKAGQELDAAHVHGKDRRTIIERVLSRYLSDGVVRCDIQRVESAILTEHGNVQEAFKFLCKNCHMKYDNLRPTMEPLTGSRLPGLSDELEVQFLPEDERKFKELLIERRRAYVLIYKSNEGIGPIKEWRAANFTERSNLRGNIFSGYLRDWRKRGITKAIFSINQSDFPPWNTDKY